MDIEKIILDIRVRAVRLGLNDKQLCKEAGIMPATFSNWRLGKCEPSFNKLQRVLDALDKLEAENVG